MKKTFTLLFLPLLIISSRIAAQGGGEFDDPSRSGPEFKTSSVLSSGKIHRVGVDQPGVYKIDFNFIKDKMKIDPSSLQPNAIGVFGNGSGRVPQWNGEVRIDDLEQYATYGFGLEDGQFNQGDYLLWYADGPDRWTYDPVDRIYNMDLNIYDRTNHFYIIVNGPTRTPIATQPNEGDGDYNSVNSLTYQRMEDEKVNLLGRYRPPGSGQKWFGDEMAVVKELDYSDRFDVRDLVASDTLNYKVRFAARASNLTRFYLNIDGKEVGRNIGGVNLVDYEYSFANEGQLQGEYVPGIPVQEILIRYPDANGINSRGWVDYIQFNFWKKNLYRQGAPLFIRDPRANYLGKPTYTIEGLTQGSLIWEITNPLSPVIQQYTNATTATFSVSTSGTLPREFVCFNPSSDVRVPVYEKEVANQNLHNIQTADLAIIYYDEFEEAALKLAEHRRTYSGLDVVAVPTSILFEEFGGGSIDPSGLRDFARMLKSRDQGFQYLCLVGDATYDYLHHFTELPYQNFVPAFETEESLDPILSFPSDDYYALLNDDEGDNLIGALDIAVGRIPVSSPTEALDIINKIIYYDNDPSTLSDWRTRVVMVADDEDGNIHLDQAEGMAVENAVDNPDLNYKKIYLDAFPQESTPGGDRYSDVNNALDLNIEKGALTVTYMGHGGQNGWSQERILGINQAQSYRNLKNMPLFITATCSFAGYDEPGFVSAGEHLLLNQEGGAIALMTTVRAVYSGSNKRLTESVLRIIYEADSPGNYPAIAEVLRRAKNANGFDTLDNNARKFTLLGDPAQKLAIPKYGVEVTEIGGLPVGIGLTDTLSALEKTSVSGNIIGFNGEVLTNFNGQLFMTVFDKVQVRKTLANDSGSSERPFITQDRQLFKGTATVTEGRWTIDFVLPKDIDFSYGEGKFSFYAHNGETDATGFFTDVFIGGVSTDGLADDLPPVIKLYMNNDAFISGGMTDANPDIYIQLSDDNGINVSGTSIGHDIEAILDGDDKNSIILNDFYLASLDDHTSGEVRYPLAGLAPGRHTLKVTAWDLANNPGEAYLDFYVVDGDGPIVKNFFNYPNPFNEITYFQFEHNRPDAVMQVNIDIFDITGQFVENIQLKDYVSGGYRIEGIEWDGTDHTGSSISPGLYVYRMRIEYSSSGTEEVVQTDAEKLVIIR